MGFLDFLGPVGSVVGSVIGGLFQNNAIEQQNSANAEENERNRQFNAQQATIAFNRQRQLNKEQNIWNSALNQRKRLEEAGLNPYMMLDGGNAGTASSSSSPQASAPSVIPMQAMRYEWLQDAAMKAAQIRLVDAQTNKTNKEADESGSRTDLNYGNLDLIKSTKVYQDIQNDLAKEFGRIEKKYHINLMDAQASLFDSQHVLNRDVGSRINTLTPLEAAKMTAETIRTQLESKNIDLNTKFGQAVFATNLAKAAAEVAAMKASTLLTYKHGTLLEQEANRNNLAFGNYKRGLFNEGYRLQIERKGLKAWGESYLFDLSSQVGVSPWHNKQFGDVGLFGYQIWKTIFPALSGVSQFLGASAFFRSSGNPPQNQHYHTGNTIINNNPPAKPAK